MEILTRNTPRRIYEGLNLHMFSKRKMASLSINTMVAIAPLLVFMAIQTNALGMSLCVKVRVLHCDPASLNQENSLSACKDNTAYIKPSSDPAIVGASCIRLPFSLSDAQSVGVCYGMDGDNLPQPSDVVALYKSNNISRMRLYSPNQAVLQALGGSNIQLILGVPNSDLHSLASDPSNATNWVQTYVLAYPNVAFRYIAVGYEVIPETQAQYVLPAMQNVHSALASAGLQDRIKVSTAVSTGVLGSSYPPSAGSFSSAAQTYLGPIVKFLVSNGSPLLANVYPYFSYAGNNDSISLPYALFTASETVIQDGQLSYQNLFDAIVDALYSALETAGGSNVPIVVSESGWPSAGGTGANISNAQTYNSNLVEHASQGTPKRPGAIETYLFSMFNEDLKQPQGVENNFGLFYPNKQPVYSISFS